MFDDLPGILLGELLVLVVARDSLLDLGNFVLGEIPAAVFAIFPGVEAVIGTVGPLAHNGKGAMLHTLDLEDLLEESLRSERMRIHGRSIDVYLYMATKKGANHKPEEI